MNSLDFISILIIALSLSADCFAIALSGSISLKTFSLRQAFRTALSFGFFQALMPLIGWLLGRTVVSLIAPYDHWVAFGLLEMVGGRMIWESLHEKEASEKKIDITRGLLLLTLSIATSIDALAVGLSFAFLDVDIALASSVIGAVAFTITLVGFLLGRKAGKIIGERAETIGGIILLLIGLRILLSHLFQW